MNPITQETLAHGLSATQAEIYYIVSLEGEVSRNGLRRMSCIKDIRTLDKAIQDLIITGVFVENHGKIRVKLHENHSHELSLHLRAREITNPPLRGGVSKDTHPNYGDMDARASNPHETPNGELASARPEPRPIRIREDLELEIGVGVEGEEVCDTAQVRNQCGRDALIRAWNETASQDWIPQGDKLTPAIRRELHALARYLLTKGNKNEPNKDWIRHMWHGRNKPSKRRRG